MTQKIEDNSKKGNKGKNGKNGRPAPKSKVIFKKLEQAVKIGKRQMITV